MPCRDDWGGAEYRTDPEVKQRLDNVTRLLCATCKRLDNAGHSNIIAATPGLSKWWEEHQKEDRRREEREREFKARERTRKMTYLKKLAKELNIEIKT